MRRRRPKRNPEAPPADSIAQIANGRVSGWYSWRDDDETLHIRVAVRPADLRAMSRGQVAALDRAVANLHAALAPDPQAP